MIQIKQKMSIIGAVAFNTQSYLKAGVSSGDINLMKALSDLDRMGTNHMTA